MEKVLEAYEIYSEQRSHIKMYIPSKGTLSKKLKVELWCMAHCILNSDPKPIAADPDELNFHFKKTM